MNSDLLKVGVIGAGSWGTALADACARAGRKVVLWARSDQLAEEINKTGVNSKYLPGLPICETVYATSQMSQLADCDMVLIVTPAQAQGRIMGEFHKYLPHGIPALICSKGIDKASSQMMSQVLADTAPDLVPYVLSGPSFAADVVKGLPTAVTLAGPDIASASKVAEAIGHATFRIYASDDIIGTQIGGAVKNVLAIACGISDGRKLGDSCRAAIITRAFAELKRLGHVLGARPETLGGLSGFGDLILTCSSTQSRNYSLGFLLGQGKSLDDILKSRKSVAEGIHTAGVVTRIASENNIEMPICKAVHAVVDGRSDPDSEIARLLARPMRAEVE